MKTHFYNHPTGRRRDVCEHFMCVRVCEKSFHQLCKTMLFSFSHFAADYYSLGYSLLLLLLSPPPHPSASSLRQSLPRAFLQMLSKVIPPPPPNHHPHRGKQTFKANQTMNHTHTTTPGPPQSSVKRRTPAEGHQEALNGHNDFQIIIHKGDFCTRGRTQQQPNEPGVRRSSSRWSTLWPHTTHTFAHSDTHISRQHKARMYAESMTALSKHFN